MKSAFRTPRFPSRCCASTSAWSWASFSSLGRSSARSRWRAGSHGGPVSRLRVGGAECPPTPSAPSRRSGSSSESCCFDRTTRKGTIRMNRTKAKARNSVWLAIALGALLALPAAAQTTDIGTLDKQTAEKAFPGKAPYSPYAGRNFPTRPFFGDTHLHTSFSMDAGAFGARLGPRDAYVFAKGSEITASSGQRAKLSRPLDFLVVADHSDGMGFFP